MIRQATRQTEMQAPHSEVSAQKEPATQGEVSAQGEAAAQGEPAESQLQQLQARAHLATTMTQAAEDFPEKYDDVSYRNIVEAWLQQKGIYGGVAEGARNNMYYQLAMDLRYITNFNRDWMLQVMPDWGLAEAERRQVIDSALKRPQGRQLPTALQEAIQKVKAVGDVSVLDEVAISNELRNPLPKRLPYVFGVIARRWRNNPHAMVLCSLPPLGALCTNVRAEYIDGELESPLFYCILTAPQASGKKVARKLDELITKPISDHDDEQRAAVREYKQQLKKMKNEKSNKQPDEPETSIRKVPANISKRTFLERCFKAEGKSLYSFGEELDSLTNGMKSGQWANLTDILRMAFDGGEFGQDYSNENSFNAVVRARWCILMSGTWGAVERFFPNVEDGTMTRFMFAQLEDSLGKPLLPNKTKNSSHDEQAISDEAKRLYELGSMGEVNEIKLPTTTKALLEWQTLQINIWRLGGKSNTALDTLRRRSMLMGFRAALVAAATENLKDSAVVANFAVWVAQEVLDQQMALFAKQLNSVNQHERSINSSVQVQMRQNSSLRLLAEMNDAFTLDELSEAYAQRGYQPSAAKVALSRWLQKGLVTAKKDDKIRTYQKKGTV